MSPWTRKPGLNNVFTRPLGQLEATFFWDSQANGISDTLGQIAIETSPSEASELFSSENVTRAWIALKNLNPILGASVHERPDAFGADFVVDESRLGMVTSDEINFIDSGSEADLQEPVNGILNGPRRLSDDKLSRLWIVSLPPDNSTSPPTVRYQILILLAHSTADGKAREGLNKVFLDILTNTQLPEKYIPRGDLEARLALYLPVDDLNPISKLPLAQQRWRFAIARVIHSRWALSLEGGHTLPCTIKPHTPQNPIISRTIRLFVPQELTKRVLPNCRRAGVTFGSVLPVLAQVAQAKILHHKYIEGSIKEEEWDYRTKEPMHFLGPINIRSYLDPEWLASGGNDRLCPAFSFYRISLPSMPISRSDSGIVGDPSFDALLPKDRFFHRCRIARQQSKHYMKHPLLLEFTEILRPRSFTRNKDHALKWRKAIDEMKRGVPVIKHEGHQVSYFKDGFVLSTACSSAGDLTLSVPNEYPLERDNGVKPRLRVTALLPNLRCRPTELYLTALTYNQQLQLIVFCDCATYDEVLVKEWLSYIRDAIEWYLGEEEVTEPLTSHT